MTKIFETIRRIAISPFGGGWGRITIAKIKNKEQNPPPAHASWGYRVVEI